VLALLGKPDSLIRFVTDRPGHDRRYAMDIGRIRKTLGWTPACRPPSSGTSPTAATLVPGRIE